MTTNFITLIIFGCQSKFWLYRVGLIYDALKDNLMSRVKYNWH